MSETVSEQPPWFEIAAQAYEIHRKAQASAGRVQSVRRFIPLPGLFLKVDYRAEWEHSRHWHEEVKALQVVLENSRSTMDWVDHLSYVDPLLEWLKSLEAFCDALQQYAYSHFSFWATGAGERDRMIGDVKRLGRSRSQATTAESRFLRLAIKKDWVLYRSLKKGTWCG